MSNRTLVELNHDYCPDLHRNGREYLDGLMNYMRSGDPRELPKGVKFIAIRNSADPEFVITRKGQRLVTEERDSWRRVAERLEGEKSLERAAALREAANLAAANSRCSHHGMNRHHSCVFCHNCGSGYRAILALLSDSDRAALDAHDAEFVEAVIRIIRKTRILDAMTGRTGQTSFADEIETELRALRGSK